jgi:phenylacetate-coenzyme A ligase PaaK-like adenylate-forming protein
MELYWNPELETKPWADVMAWQHERALSLLDDLHARSDFYRWKLGREARPSLWKALPLTTKDELRSAQDGHVPGRPLGAQQAVDLERVIQFVSSSGTTGRPVYYGLTRADLAAWADGVANTFFTAGIRPDDVVAHLVSLPIVAGGLSYAVGFQRIGAAVAWVGGLPPERMMSSLVALKTTSILYTTSFAV